MSKTETLLQYVRTEFNKDAELSTPMCEIAADSLELIDLVIRVERLLSVGIDDGAIRTFKTLNDMAVYVESLKTI